MKVVARRRDAFVLRLEQGEEVVEVLRSFALRHIVGGAWFWALGAADRIEIAFYDLKKKTYISRTFRGRLEILHITGNIAQKGRETVIHAHGVFSKSNYGTIGGHIRSCRISATCEIYLQKLPPLERAFDAQSGLNLLTG